MTDIRDLAYWTVDKVMAKGSTKDGCNESWKDKAVSYHLGKAARHAAYAFLMRSGLMDTDEDGVVGHIQNSITRLCMAMWKLNLH